MRTKFEVIQMSLEKLAVMQYQLTAEKNILIEERSKELASCSISWVRVSRDPFVDNPVFQTQAIDKAERKKALEIMSEFTDLQPLEMENCYGLIMRVIEIENDPIYGNIVIREFGGFDAILYAYGCQHCQRARTLKREIGRIGQKLGQIRGQITRYGKSLSERDK